MKRTTTPKQWIISFLVIVFAVFLLLSLIVYAVDPYYQFRYDPTPRFLSETKVNPGLVQHYDYDTLVIGSSMTQNFDMDTFRKELGVNPLGVGIGGLGLKETVDYILLSDSAGKADKYFVCIDQSYFFQEAAIRTPEYLMKNDLISKLKYCFSYEVWFRYLPFDIALKAADMIGFRLPSSIADKTNLDTYKQWESDFTFGEEEVIKNFKSNQYSVSDVDLTDLYSKAVGRIDYFFASLPEGNDYALFFPPYSALFWANAQEKGYYDVYRQAKEYFLTKAEIFGATVYDFQSQEFIADLDNYKDTTHYSSGINDYMVSCFATGECRVTQENFHEMDENFDTIVKNFKAKYAYLFDN